jgi:hypothetical protein
MAFIVVRHSRGKEVPMFRAKFQRLVLPITTITLSLKRLSYSRHEFVKFWFLSIPQWGQYVLRVLILILIFLLTAIESTPGGSSTGHNYTKAMRRTTKLTSLVGRLSGIRTQRGQTKINDELTA